MGKFRKKEEKGEITYWCDCGLQIEYCHNCGAEIAERRDDVGDLILDCVERCGWTHYLDLRVGQKRPLQSIKAIMAMAPST
jgi:hypothetical protein